MYTIDKKINPFLLDMLHGVADEMLRDEDIDIPSSMSNPKLDELEPLEFLPDQSSAIQAYLSRSDWTMGYLPIQFHKVIPLNSKFTL